MSPGSLSVLALLLAILLSCVSRVNVGLIAIPIAWLIGVVQGGGVDLAVKAFPAQLFVTLAGVTLLFALAEANGTVERLAVSGLSLARGEKRWLPVLLFGVACAVATAGPGAIAAVALLAPMGMALGRRAGLTPFLAALAIANGANAGNLSPLSVIGVVANAKMAEAGLVGHELRVWFANFVAHVVVTFAAYALLGGFKLEGRSEDTMAAQALSRAQRLTAGVIVLWMAGVAGLSLPLGFSAFAAAGILIVLGVADEAAALRRMPWSAVLMVTGMSLLVGVVERVGGLAMFTGLLARLATPATVNGVIAFVVGVISTYSSTSGVVLPTFLPMVPGLVQEMGGGEPLAVALSINVGASLVDVSPLSTLGALCLAAVAEPEASRDLFRKLMVWGLAMTAAAALLCQLLAGPLSRF